MSNCVGEMLSAASRAGVAWDGLGWLDHGVENAKVMFDSPKSWT